MSEVGIRDYQVSKVYDAQSELSPQPLHTIEESKKFALKIFNCDSFIMRYPNVPRKLTVSDKSINKKSIRENCYCHCWQEESFIALAPFGFSRWIVIHEIAHIVVFWEYEEQPDHGIVWCSVFLDLVYRHMGGKFGDELSRKFSQYDVRY